MLFILVLALLIPAILTQRDATAETLQKALRGVKKMRADEGEKFFWDYWQFDNGLSAREVGNLSGPTDGRDLRIRSYPLRPAVSIEQTHGLISLFRRDFKCPADTEACTSINQPNRCCGAGDMCQLVQDTGAGDVGCCPAGQACSEVIGSCPWEYSTCSQELGGGCCIPGYDCVEGGCAYVSTITVTVHSTVMVSTSTYSTHQITSSSSSTLTPTPSIQSSGDLVPPARPTSLSTATSSQGISETQYPGAMCPTGFYACSAVYHGGCCRTGRDCDTTSCPVMPSTTKISNGETIVIPAPTITGETGRCAQGWFSCADTVGGGCCPTGFACGSSCSATGGSTTIAKSAPKKGEGRRLWEKRGRLGLSVVVGWAVVVVVVML